MPEPTDELDTDNEDEYATYCPDCDAMFGPDEDGHDTDICIECGAGDCFEVPW